MSTGVAEPVRAGRRQGLAGALFGIAKRDLLTFTSYRFRPATQVANVFLSLVLFYYISRLVSVERLGTQGQGSYFSFAIIGVAFLPVLTAAVTAVPSSVRGELMTGTFERIIVSPLGPTAAILGMTVFPILLSVWTAFVTIVIGGVVFDLDVQWSTALWAIPISFLASAAFVPFALLATALVLFAKRAGSSTAYLVTGLSLTSGAFFPVALLPWWLRWVSEVQPLTPALDLLRHVISGTPASDPVWSEILRLALWSGVLLPISLVVVSTTIRACRRRGTLIEY